MTAGGSQKNMDDRNGFITDFLMERTLYEKDPDLHSRFVDVVVVSKNILNKYKRLFPKYTDHSALHCMTVIDSCNRLIGTEEIKKLNPDEIYILLVGCYLHDVGMGIGENDYDEFAEKLGEKEYFSSHKGDTKSDFVRKYHNELSGLFIDKYADILDIPSREHVFAVKQVARGHRLTDLYDEKEYPAEFRLPNGNNVSLPYLSAIIRLADEIDVAASRNPVMLYEMELMVPEGQRKINKTLYSIKSIDIVDDAFVLKTEKSDEEAAELVKELAGKMQTTLDYCRNVINERTARKFTLNKIVIE